MSPKSKSFYKDDRELQRARALGSSLGKTNRLLTGDRAVQVHTQTKNTMDRHHAAAGLEKYPGYTVYPNIYLNVDQFGEIAKPETMIQLLGLNYHELAHVIYTPRKFKGVLPSYLRTAFNVLEDQRIESFFTAQYEPAGKFFTEMVIRFIVGDQNAWGSAFMWTHGRSFLPLEIRDEFEQRFALPQHVEEVKKLIDRYKTFTADNFAHNRRAVTNVLRRFHEIMRELRSNGEGTPEEQCSSDDQTEGRVNTQQEEESAKEDRRKRNHENRTGEDQSNFWDEDDEEEEEDADDGSEGDGEDSDSEDDDEGGSESGTDDDQDDEDSDDDGESAASDDEDSGEGEDSSESDNGEAETSSDEDSDDDGGVGGQGEGEGDSDPEDSSDADDEGGNGAGTTAGEPQFDDDELKEYLGDIVQAVTEDQSVEEELGRMFSAINDRGNIDFIDFDTENFVLEDADLASLTSVRQITENLRRMYADVEPGWKYGSDYGKLNVGRAMLDPENFDEHFDEWEEGREIDTGLEVVFAVDLSGSMGGLRIRMASLALWILKRALEEVDAKVTVLGFHSTTVGLLGRQKKVERAKWPLWVNLGPSTLPAQSFVIARQTLNASDAPNKLFVAITDGGWGSMHSEYVEGQGWVYVQDDLSELVQAIPGTRMYVGVGGTTANTQYHADFHTVKELGSTDELVSLVRTTVDRMMRERIRH